MIRRKIVSKDIKGNKKYKIKDTTREDKDSFTAIKRKVWGNNESRRKGSRRYAKWFYG